MTKQGRPLFYRMLDDQVRCLFPLSIAHQPQACSQNRRGLVGILTCCPGVAHARLWMRRRSHCGSTQTQRLSRQAHCSLAAPTHPCSAGRWHPCKSSAPSARLPPPCSISAASHRHAKPGACMRWPQHPKACACCQVLDGASRWSISRQQEHLAAGQGSHPRQRQRALPGHQEGLCAVGPGETSLWSPKRMHKQRCMCLACCQRRLPRLPLVPSALQIPATLIEKMLACAVQLPCFAAPAEGAFRGMLDV